MNPFTVIYSVARPAICSAKSAGAPATDGSSGRGSDQGLGLAQVRGSCR